MASQRHPSAAGWMMALQRSLPPPSLPPPLEALRRRRPPGRIFNSPTRARSACQAGSEAPDAPSKAVQVRNTGPSAAVPLYGRGVARPEGPGRRRTVRRPTPREIETMRKSLLFVAVAAILLIGASQTAIGGC